MPDQRKIIGWMLCIPFYKRKFAEMMAGEIAEHIANFHMYVRPRYDGDELGPCQEIANDRDVDDPTQ